MWVKLLSLSLLGVFEVLPGGYEEAEVGRYYDLTLGGRPSLIRESRILLNLWLLNP